MEEVIEISSDDEGSVQVEDTSSDSTESFSREEAQRRQRDPRLGREYYRRQEERAPPRRVHTALRSTMNVASRMDGLIQFIQARYTTVYIQVPRGGTTPPLVEEPPSPPRPPGSPESYVQRCADDTASSGWATLTPWTASEEEEIPAGEIDDGSPSRGRDGGRERSPSVNNPAPETAARDGLEEEHLDVSGRRDGTVRVEDASSEEDGTTNPIPRRRASVDAEEERQPESVRITLRYTPGTVENRRLSRASQSSTERPTGRGQAAERRRRRRRRRGRPVSERESDSRTPASQGKTTDGAEGPSTHRQRRERSTSTSGRGRSERRDESTETRSSEERRLLADMAELLDGREVNLEEVLGEEDAESRRMLPSIPIGWRVHPAGTELSAEVIQLLRRETRGRRHRRTRFRVAAGEQAYTVTVNSSGAW
ncbi:serine/arginine repetitive matrix protein 5-like [Drosophila mojavensis]|uniref:serine/arginine repetitive matrix protein 5-like n=1 Tax=Drosophila mojavensis TaxID=7230 RepID=UPI001CD12DC8|nr:serine/arginine repetitive matrix protein 5-like [Drosophila mojavensis]